MGQVDEIRFEVDGTWLTAKLHIFEAPTVALKRCLTAMQKLSEQEQLDADQQVDSLLLLTDLLAEFGIDAEDFPGDVVYQTFEVFVEALEDQQDLGLGQLLWLREALSEHREGVAYELLRHGYRLRHAGSDELRWGDVFVLCSNAPSGSPLAASFAPSNAWSVDQHLLANLVDQLNALLFGLSDGKGDKPKPVQRPGQTDESTERKTYQGLPMSIEQADALKKRFEAPQPE